MRVFRKQHEDDSVLICAKKTLARKSLVDFFGEEKSEKIEKIIEATKQAQCGLFFTNKDSKAVQEAIKEFGGEAFAQVGQTSMETIEITNKDLEHFSSSNQPYFESIGIPNSVVDGKIVLVAESHTVCKKDDVINSNQSKQLVIFFYLSVAYLEGPRGTGPPSIFFK